MANIIGTNGPDGLTGTASADIISALSGNDRAYGLGGIDVISGGGGSDTLGGGDGDDVLYGYGSGDPLPGAGEIRATLVSNAFDRPIFAMSAPGDAGRLYAAEQHTGRIRILDPATGAIEPTPFLDIPDSELTRGGEQGLLGFAFHPDYAANGEVYVYLTNAQANIEVRRYQRSAADPDRADATGDVILTIAHPNYSNHNGGWMGFGQDGFLYISVGDGGSGGDPDNNAQNKNLLLGKMLRIDVDGDDFAADPNRDYRIPTANPFVNQAGADEIWALGLRNGWRPSFDRLTGDLYIADVGQGEREEVNFQAAGSAGGENYGWKVKEGFLVYDDTVPGNPPATVPPLTDPLIDYPHVAGPGGGFSITGGYVYRGSSPGLQGHYFFADFVSNQLWTFRVVNGAATEFANRTAQLVAIGGSIDSISSFSEDGLGNLYIIGLDGEMFRIDPQAADGGDTLVGDAGNDRIYGGGGSDTAYGGAGNDRIDGGADNDPWLSGDAGNDTVTGGAGGDTMSGGSENDILYGEAGRDRAMGGTGADTLYGGDETGAGDSLLGDAGADWASGGQGDDRIDGGADNDRYLGGDAGADIVTGGAGADRLDGGAGKDLLYGQDDGDTAMGGDGADMLYGGLGSDTLYGNSGDDYIQGDAQNDNLYGGAGLDRFNFDPGNGSDAIFDFTNDQDTLIFDQGFGFATAAAVVAATIQSGAHARILLGGGNQIYLWNYLTAGSGNTIGNLSDDIVIG